MARIVDLAKRPLPLRAPQNYQSIPGVDYAEGEESELRSELLEQPRKVSVFEYGVFMLLGIAM